MGPKFTMLEATNFTLPGMNDHPKLACSFVRWRPLQGANGTASPDLDSAPLRLSLVFLHCNGTRKYLLSCILSIRAT